MLFRSLAAVTAAVVGVIANLALFFIAAVARPLAANGLIGPIDWVAVAMVAAAALALWRLKWSVIQVIAVAAGTGLVLRLLGWA